MRKALPAVSSLLPFALLTEVRAHPQSGWWQVQPISIMCTLDASSHSSEQYLLPSDAGQPQVSRAHLFFGLSSAISTSSFSTVRVGGFGGSKFRPEMPPKSRGLLDDDADALFADDDFEGVTEL